MNIEVKKTEQASTNLRIELKNIPDMTIISYRVFVTEDNVLYSGFDRKIAQEMYEELNKAAAGTDVKPKHEYKEVDVKHLVIPKGKDIFDVALPLLPEQIRDLVNGYLEGKNPTQEAMAAARVLFPKYFNVVAIK
jgi:hypothetical protein